MKRVLAAAAMFAAMAIPAAAQDAQSARTAGGLPSGVTPVRYDITVTPNAADLTLAGQVKIDLRVAAPTREIVLNALELTFDRVDLAGQRPQVRFDARAQTAHLTFARPIPAGEHALNISYRGRIYQSAQGMFASDYDTAQGRQRALYTQFEAADARRFVPSFDEPGLKAIFQINAVVPENRLAVSNMPITGTDRLDGGLKRVRFQPTPVMSSYLMFLGVCDCERITTNVGNVEVGVITKRGDGENGRFALQSAAQVLPYFNDYFGTPYPLPKLDMIAGPGAGGFGAMENWGAIFYFERSLLVNPAISSEADRQGVFGTVAHEIAHQWFGNLVTMAWWDDLWLNEGFATWMASKAAENFYPAWNPWLQAQRRRQGAMNQDARETSHSIVQRIDTVDQASQAFDNITYRKGAAVIRMIEMHVGPDGFRDGVRTYMRDHAYANARTIDLWNAVERASSTPMRRIAEDFTHKPGVPMIVVEPEGCNRAARDIVLRQSRFGYDEPSRQPQRWHVPVAAAMVHGDTRVGGVTDDSGAIRLSLSNCSAYVINPGQTSYYRVSYPRSTFGQLTQVFSRLTPMDQYGLIADTRALGNAGVGSYTDFFQLARRAPATADPLVWEVIANELLATEELYAGLPGRDAYRQFSLSLLQPVFERVGWERRNGESDNTGVLRERLITALAALGDQEVADSARDRFVADRMPGAIRAATLNAVGTSANAATFDTLIQRARQSTGTLQKRSYYLAAARASDPTLAQRALDLAFHADVPMSLGPQIINTVAEKHPMLAWRFSAAHQRELAERLDSLSRVQFMPNLTGNGADEELRAELRRYIDTSVPSDVRRSPEEAYLRLQQRIRLRQEKLPELDAWLRTYGN